MREEKKKPLSVQFGRFWNAKMLLLIKYLFSIILTLVAFSNIPSKKYLLCCLLELGIIALISNLAAGKAGYIVNVILMLFFNIQIFVLYFGSSFISLAMVTNLDSLEDLSGNFGIYLVGVILLLIFSFLPIRRIEITTASNLTILSVFLAMELFFAMYFGNAYSPMYGYFELARQQYQITQQRKALKSTKDYTENYLRQGIADYIQKPDCLEEKPNVVLIMTEGLSKHVISDSRNIMPNVAAYQEQSISFDNYYNHTFATYRGIMGQLYSGYQLENFDENTLISAQSIFSDLGYQTSFVNAEPNNAQFTAYLESMGFDRVIGEPGDQYHGGVKSLSDKELYEELFDTLMEQHESGTPFFTTVYTFGTHASFNSTDEMFQDGNDPMLNKFYNADYQFGKFMEQFVNSPLYEDTIIVFTTDHATYADKYYNDTFSNWKRESADLDEIPFFIYHKGVEARTIDVSGRNSLDMIPTVFDYLDISQPNYFLGVTLFVSKDNGNNYDTVFQSGTKTLSTQEGLIGPLSESSQKIFDDGVEKYFIAKLQRVKP